MTKKKTKRIYRQGDVLIISAEMIPAQLEPIPVTDARGIILAHGEVTGHAHAIQAPPSVATLFQTRETVDRILRSTEPLRLYHDEHAPIELPAGDHVVRIQREYDGEYIRTVVD